MKVAWGITGSGYWLEESIKVLESLEEVDIFISNAGADVLRIYGLEKKVHEIGDEILLERDEWPSFPRTGRFLLRKYKLFVVSPATSNTVAKIAHGISDTLITTCVSLAVKGGIPVIIVPSDYGNLAETPILIDREECALCEDCYPAWFCHAIERGRKSYRIDYRRCDGCGKCIPLCKIGAIKKEKFQVSQRDIDLKNIEIVKKMEGMKILEHPERIIREIKILQKRPLQD